MIRIRYHEWDLKKQVWESIITVLLVSYDDKNKIPWMGLQQQDRPIRSPIQSVVESHAQTKFWITWELLTLNRISWSLTHHSNEAQQWIGVGSDFTPIKVENMRSNQRQDNTQGDYYSKLEFYLRSSIGGSGFLYIYKKVNDTWIYMWSNIVI